MGRDPDRGWHLLGRITRGEWIVAAVVAVTFGVLILLRPDILEAPVQNLRTIVFTVGGTILAAIALVVMLRRDVHPVVRVVVLVVPLIVVSTWLISPFFIDEVVEDEFDTSIAAASDEAGGGAGAGTSVPETTAPSVPAPAPTAAPPTTSAPSGDPVLLGAGRFQGLAGHDGTGDAGIFALADSHHVVRLENLASRTGPTSSCTSFRVPMCGRWPTDRSTWAVCGATWATRPTTSRTSSSPRRATGRCSCGAEPSRSNSSTPPCAWPDGPTRSGGWVPR